MTKRRNRPVARPTTTRARTDAPAPELAPTVVTPTVSSLPDSPEERRAQAVHGLSEPGQQRMRLTADLLALDLRLRPLVIRAAVAGVPYRRIAELTGISHATVARWLKDAGPLDL